MNRACRGCDCTDDHACTFKAAYISDALETCWWVDLDEMGKHGGPLCSQCARDIKTTPTETEPS